MTLSQAQKSRACSENWRKISSESSRIKLPNGVSTSSRRCQSHLTRLFLLRNKSRWKRLAWIGFRLCLQQNGSAKDKPPTSKHLYRLKIMRQPSHQQGVGKAHRHSKLTRENSHAETCCDVTHSLLRQLKSLNLRVPDFLLFSDALQRKYNHIFCHIAYQTKLFYQKTSLESQKFHPNLAPSLLLSHALPRVIDWIIPWFAINHRKKFLSRLGMGQELLRRSNDQIWILSNRSDRSIE